MTLAQLHPAGDFVSDEIRRTGQPYELDILEEIARWMDGAIGTIVDVGAHIGNHTAWLADALPRMTVEAYEPWPASFEILAANTVHAHNVRLHRLALSDQRGRLLIGRVDDNPGHVGSISEDASFFLEHSTAFAVPLDSQHLTDVQLIKIDVEGHEARVLAGAAATIERDRPVIVLEDWELDVPYPAGYELQIAWPNQQTYLLAPI